MDNVRDLNAGQRGILFGLPRGAEPNTLIVVRDAILDTQLSRHFLDTYQDTYL